MEKAYVYMFQTEALEQTDKGFGIPVPHANQTNNVLIYLLDTDPSSTDFTRFEASEMPAEAEVYRWDIYRNLWERVQPNVDLISAWPTNPLHLALRLPSDSTPAIFIGKSQNVHDKHANLETLTFIRNEKGKIAATVSRSKEQ